MANTTFPDMRRLLLQHRAEMRDVLTLLPNELDAELEDIIIERAGEFPLWTDNDECNPNCGGCEFCATEDSRIEALQAEVAALRRELQDRSNLIVALRGDRRKPQADASTQTDASAPMEE